MIYLSAILVVLAFVLLVAGVWTGTAVLVMWSIVVSVLSAVFLMIGALLRRHELFPSGGTTAADVPQTPPAGAGVAAGVTGRPGAVAASAVPPRGPSSPYAGMPMAAPHMATRTAPPRAFPPAGAARGPAAAGAAGRLAADAIVLVIPGRRRFHLAGCRQLAGREFEELTYEEAREEGFSACTTCLPDTYRSEEAAGPERAGDAGAETRLRSESGAGAEQDIKPRAGVSGEPRAETGPTHKAGGKDPAGASSRGGYISEPTRPVRELPEEPAMEPVAKTPGRAGATTGSTSANSASMGAAGVSSGSEKTPASTTGPKGPATTGSQGAATTGSQGAATAGGSRGPASAARGSEASAGAPGGSKDATGATSRLKDTAGAEEESSRPSSVPTPLAGIKPVTLPEAVTPFQAFKRPTAAKPDKPEDAEPAGSFGDRATGASASGATGKGAPSPSSGSSGEGATSPSPAKGTASSSRRDTGSPSTEPGPGKAQRPAEAAPGRSAATDGKAAATAPKPARPSAPSADTQAADDDSDDDSPVVIVTGPTRSAGTSGGAGASSKDSGKSSVTATGSGKAGGTASAPGKAAEPAEAGEDTGGQAEGGKPRKSESTREVMRPGIVKVIPGTRRYHSSACPLIKGSDPGTLEAMSESDAEAAGLTHCSVCENS